MSKTSVSVRGTRSLVSIPNRQSHSRLAALADLNRYRHCIPRGHSTRYPHVNLHQPGDLPWRAASVFRRYRLSADGHGDGLKRRRVWRRGQLAIHCDRTGWRTRWMCPLVSRSCMIGTQQLLEFAADPLRSPFFHGFSTLVSNLLIEAPKSKRNITI